MPHVSSPVDGKKHVGNDWVSLVCRAVPVLWSSAFRARKFKRVATFAQIFPKQGSQLSLLNYQKLLDQLE